MPCKRTIPSCFLRFRPRRTRTLSRMSGMYSVSRITPNGAANTLESQRLSEYDFIMGTQEEQTFLEENPEAPWVVLAE